MLAGLFVAMLACVQVGYAAGDAKPSQEKINDQRNSSPTLDEQLQDVIERVETLRGVEFTTRPTITRLNTSEYHDTVSWSAYHETAEMDRQWREAVWNVLLLSGTQSREQFREAHIPDDGVAYLPGTDRLVVLEPGDGVNQAALVREVARALEIRTNGISIVDRRANTLDGQHGRSSLYAGVPLYIVTQYVERCEGGEWDCPQNYQESYRHQSYSDTHTGFKAMLALRETHGKSFVHRTIAQGGWEALNAVYESPPAGSSEIIQPNSPGATTIDFTDTSNSSWSRYRTGPETGLREQYDAAGEYTIQAMFFHHGIENNAGPLEKTPNSLELSSSDLDKENWGLAADQIYPYHHTDSNMTGSVWTTEWHTEKDAVRFARGYIEVLEGIGGSAVSNTTYSINGGEFAGTYRVVQFERHVTIVHSDSVEAVNSLRSEYYFGESEPIPVSTIASTSQLLNSSSGGSEDDGQDGQEPTTDDGFSPVFITMFAIIICTFIVALFMAIYWIENQ